LSVPDASVVADALIGHGPHGAAAEETLREQPVVDAPAILKAEVLSALRRVEALGEVSASVVRDALDQLSRLGVRSHPVDPHMERIWELRANVSVYDAWYVAVAEALETTLVTTDQRLATAPGPRCPIEVIGPAS
jgi:predicted nucleic acid-binding protein